MQKIRHNLKLFIQQEANLLEATTIRSVYELNQKFKQINDIYSFHNLIEQISGHISKLIFEKDKFNKFMRRLIEAICFALEKYVYDFSRTAFLVDTLNMVKKHWKQVLAQEFSEVLQKKNQAKSKFLYVLSKNEYMIYVLKGSNVLIEKQIFRLIKNNSINLNSLYYIKKCYLKNVWTKIYDEMVDVANETENQTYLKIELLAQFMKHILFQVNFCITQSDFVIVYQRLFELAGYAFRLIKKFYSAQIFPLIQTIKQILLKGILIYREISFEFPNKTRYLTNFIKLFQQKKPKKRKGVTIFNGNLLNSLKNNLNEEDQHPPLNSKSYAIKLALRLMATWKKVKSRKDKQTLQKEKFSLTSNNFKSLSNFRGSNKDAQKRENFLFSLQKQQNELKNKAQRSASVQMYNTKQLPLLHNVQIRKQIEDQIDKEFGKLKYLKNYTNIGWKQTKKPQTAQKGSQRSLRSLSIQRKKSFSLKEVLGIQPRIQRRKDGNQQKEIDIEEYKEKLNLCRKQVNSQNSIKLYHPDKRSLLPHGGQKITTATSSSFGHKSILLAPNQIKQKLRL